MTAKHIYDEIGTKTNCRFYETWTSGLLHLGRIRKSGIENESRNMQNRVITLDASHRNPKIGGSL